MAHDEPVESGGQIRVPLMSVVPEAEQGARKDILRELALPVCHLAWIWGGEAGKGWAQQSHFTS